MCKDTAFYGNSEVISEKISNFAADLNIFYKVKALRAKPPGCADQLLPHYYESIRVSRPRRTVRRHG